MSIKFVWEESYSVGNERIDNQHKGMFDLANSFEAGLDEQQVNRIIMSLYKYTREHFVTEEQMMEKNGYPKLEKHLNMHDDLITKLNEVSIQKFDNEESIFMFKKFVFDWLISHILNQDKDYFQYTND